MPKQKRMYPMGPVVTFASLSGPHGPNPATLAVSEGRVNGTPIPTPKLTYVPVWTQTPGREPNTIMVPEANILSVDP